ncbi:MAG: murein hydrolase activator EnvC family protein, partial [Sphingomicrobium sp.]
QTARAAAAALVRLDFAPARPMRGDSALPTLDFAYSLPVAARLIEGLGSVNRAGIVSRGLRFDTSRGVSVTAPADGKLAFAAPYRGEDGLIIIDHGHGWTSLLLGVASDHPRGTRVRRGEFLGRALGPVGVELRHDGKVISPAFIAASSVPLSNGGNSR